jgi:transcriptional regulator with XRE-family HTH domain
MISVELKSPNDVRHEIASRFRLRRLEMNLTQQNLAERSGVSWGSLKRFETTGQISLDALLKLALVLKCLGDFERLAVKATSDFGALTLDDLLARNKARRRASNKPLSRK